MGYLNFSTKLCVILVYILYKEVSHIFMFEPYIGAELSKSLSISLKPKVQNCCTHQIKTGTRIALYNWMQTAKILQ